MSETNLKDLATEILKRDDSKLFKQAEQAFRDALVYGTAEIISLSRGYDYEGDSKPNELLYSSILGKYINPATGEVVEQEEK